ncbi:14-3-3 domain-containing protein [Mycena galericulata]|nr:14-3-3 domain-containing protein [Mycena galericulata]
MGQRLYPKNRHAPVARHPRAHILLSLLRPPQIRHACRKCTDIIQILKDHLLQSTQSCESLVFFRKMMGDFYRYLAEFSTEVERRSHIEQALEAYTVASHLASHDPEIPPTHPTRLGLAINFSIFYHDILENLDEGWEHAHQAFNDGIKHLDLLTEETYRESIFLLQLLKENVMLWSF